MQIQNRVICYINSFFLSAKEIFSPQKLEKSNLFAHLIFLIHHPPFSTQYHTFLRSCYANFLSQVFPISYYSLYIKLWKNAAVRLDLPLPFKLWKFEILLCWKILRAKKIAHASLPPPLLIVVTMFNFAIMAANKETCSNIVTDIKRIYMAKNTGPAPPYWFISSGFLVGLFTTLSDFLPFSFTIYSNALKKL